MISIIVPAYNCEFTLDRCVESVLSQQFKDFELLLVDDGSTDGTPALCDAYAAKDSRVRAFHKPNGGVSSARNMGLDNATGEWITFADSDDELMAGALSLIAMTVARQNIESPDLILENLNIVHQGEPGFTLYGPGLDNLELLYRQGLWGAVWNKTFSKSIIEKHNIRYDESLHLSEDCLFVATYCAHVKGVEYIETPCYIQYVPESYGKKYSKYNSFENELELYRKIKAVNQTCSVPMVDALTMSLIHKMASGGYEKDVVAFKDAVGNDIRYAQGKKKFAIRLLHLTDSLTVWKQVLKVSSKLV